VVNLLILGGTIFLGRHLVEVALQCGHQVTIFNRGRHQPELFPKVEKLLGDRDGGLDVLRGRRWDAVIDTSGYMPRLVRASAELLAEAVEHYTFISSISVYADFNPAGSDESAPLQTLSDPTVETVTAETYGGLKALCEQAAEAAMPSQVLNVRAGLLVGPYDSIPRFAYWLQRVAQGGEVLAPGRPDRSIQLIDARDVAEWIIRMVEARVSNVYNVTGALNTLTMGQLLNTIRVVSGSEATLTWVEDSFLLQQGVQPFDGLPFWVPAEMEGVFKVSVERATAAGLTYRPIADTVRDTLAWLTTHQPTARAKDVAPIEMPVGLSPEREAALLRAWRQREAP
jgi:2'-hydroxyisoflavone reductase